MSTFAQKIVDEDIQALEVSFTEDQICLLLSDGREIKTPLAFYPSLLKSTPEQRKNFKIIGLGSGIHWPDLDEDLSVEGIILGRKAFNYEG